jgi:rhodanese-related sulfurtransferase
VHLPRTVVEWRIDPVSGYSVPEATGLDQRIVVYCNDGYSSSFAAANLRRLGFDRATDLIGGFDGWVRAGLPVTGR